MTDLSGAVENCDEVGRCSSPPLRSWVVTALFGLTMTVSAALLFAAQPMLARMALPTLGGSPAVWNTCMVFFQAAVLAGYLLAHFLARKVCPRPAVGVFLILSMLAGAGLPMIIAGDTFPRSGRALTWLLGQLTAEAFLPAMVLAATSPLLQRWYGEASSRRAEPYFLYVASNVGSLGALLAYPIAIERLLPLAAQARAWQSGYWIWAILVAACGLTMLARRRQREVLVPDPDPPLSEPGPSTSRPSEVLAWIALAAVPASLLQGCTLFLTTDLASVPLLWVIPLALYLVTFVLTFSRFGPASVRTADRALPFLAVAVLYMVLSRSTQPVLLILALHLVFLLAAGLVCHGRLVERRPPPAHLTQFYLALSLGGVAGGAFNAFLAPLLFRTVAEYPLAIAAACAALPARALTGRSKSSSGWRDLSWALALGILTLCLGLVMPWLLGDGARWRDGIVFGIAAVAACTQLDRPRRLALTIAAIFGVGLWLQSLWAGTRHAERNFFGITRVTVNASGDMHQLVHGNTFHGRQFRDTSRRGEPLTYYHRQGPLGGVFETLRTRLPTARIGVIGLGIGSMAAYAQPGDSWVFYEIDPAVLRVAQDPKWFTFLSDCAARDVHLVEGDARLRLGESPDDSFDLLVLDAFSSDSIPVHLLTREAVTLYRQKLRADGWLMAHISNRYLNLEPVLAALARDAGWACRSADDSQEHDYPGKEPSHWIVMARDDNGLGRLARLSRWVPAEGDDRMTLWTDQRSSVFEAFDWR
ncbi:MAG: fused MFS/spermidine synthase [Verrucomicrobiales bacterium]|nr:fused MFS/spermidine synthase [Verrucomicrobiales bacterium]